MNLLTHRPPTAHPSRRLPLPPLFGLWLALAAVVLSACAKEGYYDIATRTDVAKGGNTVIRWQVNPGMEGTVKIFASDNASSYPTVPVVTEPISKQFASIPVPGSEYVTQYFLMVFDGRETRVVSSRIIPTVSFTNLRDIGGYMTKTGDQIRWGVIYRGNNLSRLTPTDSRIASSLGIRNQVYLQDQKDLLPEAVPGRTVQSILLPPDVETSSARIRRRILEGGMDRPAVIDAREDLLASFAFENPKQLSAALHFLLDEGNYPLLLSDSLGNGRVAVLTALIQSALGVPQRDIIEDYMLSNALTPVSKLEPEGYKYPALVQESLIEHYTNRPNDLQYIFYQINRRYGSVEKYLDKVLSFDREDIDKLRALLLY